LATAATKDIISFATAIFIMGRKNAEETYGLSSPYRQAQFLLGLLSSTPELTPEATSPTTQYETIAKLLEAAFTAYAREIFVLERDGRPITPEAVRDVEIAGGAIINHYMAGRLATVDQTKNRIRGVFRSVDDRLETVCGLRSTDILAICDWITTAVLARLDEHRHTEVAFRNLHESWSNEVRGLNDSDAMALPSYAAVGAAAADWSASLQTINTFSRVALIATFADKAAAFLRLFVTSRGANPAFREVGARNPARYAPLFALDDDLIAMPLGNGLYDGVLDTLSELSRNNFSEAYARARGKYVERRVAELFRTLFPASAMLLCNCFQDPASRDEHDLVILHDRVLYVIESKGAPPIAPPTDARRAAVRLERAFGSDRGIQYGFSQARKVLDKIDAGESVRFYRRDRNVALELGPDEIDSEFAVIVTGDDFGALACDLATLLKKAPCEPYPWAVNLYDLESLLEGFRMRDWGPPEFRRFLEQRQGLHGHIIASDELDVAGAFLRYGSLEMLPIEPDTKIQMDFGEIFDEIYVANLGGPDVAWGTGPPSFVDLRSQLTQIMMKDDSSALWEGVLPLDPCPCGSTLRYRDCHGIE
ncbi:MAG TPA: SEC-C domain-containing protein, partial [Gemmatimonadaceae bacterium]